MNEQSIELEFYERRLSNLEHTVYGNGRKGIKDELIELKTEINTFKRLAVWQIGILIAVFLGVMRSILG